MSIVLDPIRTFMGNIDDAEHERRKRILSARNVASYRVTRSNSSAARSMLWTLCDAANLYVFAPADLETLTEVAEFCRRLLITADMAEKLLEDAHAVD